MRALPDGTVELLSTHDQLLGGPSGQTLPRLHLPGGLRRTPRAIAEPAHGRSAGTWPGSACSAGSPSTSSSVRDEAGGWTPYAIELNLRKGGTTHPFLTLQFLTDGRYDGDAGVFLHPSGHEKHLVATDHLEDDRLEALTVDDLFDIVARHRLHFDQSRQTGVVFHMISCLTECGRLGLTAVGDDAEAGLGALPGRPRRCCSARPSRPSSRAPLMR